MGTVSLPQKQMTLSAPELHRPVAADAFRVLAIGMVGWFHIWQQSWQGAGEFTYLANTGAAWVDGMVMLSAFCLFLPYANRWAEKQQFPALRAMDFYRKRVVRILPPYYFCLLVALIVTLVKSGITPGLGWDLAAHLTLTQQLFPVSYLSTRLNGAAWTLTVFALFYLVFPLLAKAMFYTPVWTGLGMFGVQLLWRQHIVPLYGTEKYASLFNQIPAFASTLALGMWGAMLFAVVGRSSWMQKLWIRIACTLGGVGGLWAVNQLLRQLNYAPEYQLWQIENRSLLVLCMTCTLILFGLGLPLPGGRLWKFLSGISYNFYLWHQMLTVWLKYDFHLPFWAGDTPPNQLGDQTWIWQSNLLYWVAALTAAILVTYLVEKPIEKRLTRKPQKVGV